MPEDTKKQDQLIETTDCLEAVATLKFNKNLFFFIILICLLILQAIFWLIPTRYIDKAPAQESQSSANLSEQKISLLAAKPPKVLVTDVNTEPNEPNIPAKTILRIPPIKLQLSQVIWIIKPCNFLLIVCSCLYSLSLLFAMMVSLVGKLGGIRHITNAVFVSFWIIILILPWQLLFKDVLWGVIYTPTELLNAWQTFDRTNILANILMFLRFSVLWLFVVILLFWAQLRSMRWSKNSLKRLGIVG